MKSTWKAMRLFLIKWRCQNHQNKVMRVLKISDGITNSNIFHILEIVNEEETEKLIPAGKWKEIVLIADGAKNAQPKVEVIY